MRGAAGLVAMLEAPAAATLFAAVRALAGRGASPSLDHLRSRASTTHIARIAFLGDVEEHVTGLRALLLTALAEGATAAVLLGDLVRRPGPGRYRLLCGAIPPAMDGRVVAVPGNRDLKDGGRCWRSSIGDRAWVETVGDVLLVGIDNGDGEVTEESRAVLEAASSGARTARRVVLVSHVPFHVDGLARADAERGARGLADVARLLGGRTPDVVVSGHVALWQVSRDPSGTLHVCCGGRESDEHWPGTGAPTAALIEFAGPETIVRRLTAPKTEDPADRIRRSVTRAAEFLLRPRMALAAILLAAAGFVLASS